MIARLREEGAIFLHAVQFLTRLPVPQSLSFSPDRLHAATRYFPLVGALVGVFGAIVFTLSHLVFPQSVAALISMCATLLATGAFHEDGLADTFDGIGGGAARERALEIMKDSRIGAYGACALVMAFALKGAALFAMPTVAMAWMLLSAHCVSRFSSVVVIASSHYVRDHGTGKPVAAGLSPAGFAFAAASALAVWALCGLSVSWPAALGGSLGAMAGHVAMRLFFERKLGGYTGDCLGAVQQASEVGFYLGALAWLSS
jgi:adenosylcobinamide-GDP ribazoletransferase